MKKPYCQHVHVVCKDLQPMIDFWVNCLGATLEEFRKFGGADGAALNMGSTTKLYIKVMPCEPQVSPTIHAGTEHLGFLVESLDEAMALAKTFPGGKVVREPFMSGSLRCAFITGPENVLVEIMEEPA